MHLLFVPIARRGPLSQAPRPLQYLQQGSHLQCFELSEKNYRVECNSKMHFFVPIMSFSGVKIAAEFADPPATDATRFLFVVNFAV